MPPIENADLPYADADLVCDLILGNLDLVARDLEKCVMRLQSTAREAENRGSIVLGHVYRLLESAVGMEEAIEYCEKSARFYEEAGLARSAAQSHVTVTRHLARLGRIDEARSELDKASASLQDAASSRQLFLNNLAAVELLAGAPDFAGAEAHLRSALLLSRDKYSDLTILQNLAIAIWQGRRAEHDPAAAAAHRDGCGVGPVLRGSVRDRGLLSAGLAMDLALPRVDPHSPDRLY